MFKPYERQWSGGQVDGWIGARPGGRTLVTLLTDTDRLKKGPLDLGGLIASHDAGSVAQGKAAGSALAAQATGHWPLATGAIVLNVASGLTPQQGAAVFAQMNGHSKLGWYVLLDKQGLAGASSKNLSGQALADELVKAIRSPQDIQNLDVARTSRFRNVAFGGATVLGGVLMALNFTKLLDDVESGMSHELEEAKTKLAVGKIAIGGFVAEQLASGLEKLGETRLRNMAGRFGGYLPNILKLAGRFAGFGTGVFLGIWDISKGVEAGLKGDAGLSRAYVASGIAAIGISSIMFLVAMGTITLGPLGWFLVVAGVLVWLVATFLVESLQDNPRQEWLFRCHFGTAPASEKYQDAKTQVEQYKRALAA